MDLKFILKQYDDEYTHKHNVVLALTQFNFTHIPYSSKPEIWKPLAYPNVINDRYIVSSWGRVYDLLNQYYLTPALCDKGYVRITLQRTNDKFRCVRIHSLVATAFIPNPENKLTVNHKDFDKQNNTVENLEWMSNNENLEHANENKRFLLRENKSLLTKKEVEIIKLKHKNGMSFTKIAKEYQRLPRTISDIVNGRTYNQDFWFNQGFRKENIERYNHHYTKNKLK
jgi:hypothetical protein